MGGAPLLLRTPLGRFARVHWGVPANLGGLHEFGFGAY